MEGVNHQIFRGVCFFALLRSKRFILVERTFRNRESCLRAGSIFQLDQPFSEKFLEKADQVACAAFRLDVVFIGNRGLNLGDRARLVYQLPDSRPDGIETVVDATLDVQDRGFPCKVARYLIFRGDDDGAIGNSWTHTPSSFPLESRG